VSTTTGSPLLSSGIEYPLSAGTAIGSGYINIEVTMVVNTPTKPQSFSPVSFRVNFEVTNNDVPIRLLIPRGKTISDIFHPGFSLPAFQTNNVVAGSDTEVSVSVKFEVGGAATGMRWHVAMANPANPYIRNLLTN
jgi:hypothetical protein